MRVCGCVGWVWPMELPTPVVTDRVMATVSCSTTLAKVVLIRSTSCDSPYFPTTLDCYAPGFLIVLSSYCPGGCVSPVKVLPGFGSLSEEVMNLPGFGNHVGEERWVVPSHAGYRMRGAVIEKKLRARDGIDKAGIGKGM
ncbi:hypothetical protein L1987_19744 [Smallanthus sonchifolius]|uniref:Uncharacterized protein n=1 Tax=Smallanthus sonchifolius TaxID=185202 RepID=A0ACB9IQ44_9ASTR|nr:hypothetical protein L1987_19744 [Smallanthus sonchifolius]